ncbi:biotin--[acetyl-CoA-carboxylase] ligase [Paucibacter sp. APW11]|uniref:biotin--[biotin carboxyl-carrier protein] ligase n=1 Tax=Roseateles aquae TaxID=3077235 RepID=A0ABU3PAE9_9BURK|nr:biotin--[acetyl-CoA-carboxylase] ligase [Paucibacter sp. APW11]MDT8999546.1 biotin--[acetyl-CoA-carboxylase] ligase [Paucibacter sp. APW11]
MTTTEHQNWGVEALWQELEPLLPGLSIEVLARAESTNTALLERVKSEGRHPGERGAYGRRAHDMQPCLLVAEHQTHGRGRMGRSWHAVPGASLTFSLAMPLDLADWSGLSLTVGCAIAEALEPSGNAAPRLQLKWPNDIWLDGRKLGGILIETVPAGGQRMAVIGIGLNVGHRPSDAAEAQFLTGFASLDELEQDLTPPEVLRRIAGPLIRAVTSFGQTGFGAWASAYARRDLLQGREIYAGALEGLGRGVNTQGELLLQTAEGMQTISGGEVSIRLTAPPPVQD